MSTRSLKQSALGAFLLLPLFGITGAAGCLGASPDGGSVEEPSDRLAPEGACAGTAFTEAGFSGAESCVGLGSFTALEGDAELISPAALRSLHVEAGYAVSVFTREGGKLTFGTSQDDLAARLAGQTIARIEATACPVGFFDETGAGEPVCFAEGAHAVPAVVEGRTLIVKPGLRVTARFADGSAEALDTASTSPAAVQRIDVALDDLSSDERASVDARDHKNKPPAPTPAGGVKHLVIFGDSLSDQTNQWNQKLSGRCPNPTVGYWAGRFTNGFNWVDYFNQDNQLQVHNFAVGGAYAARTSVARPSLDLEITRAKNLPPAAETMVVIWMGANDLVDANTKAPNTPDKLAASVKGAVGSAVDRLHKMGYHNITLISVPTLSSVPAGHSWPAAKRTWIGSAQAKVLAAYENLATTKALHFVPIHTFIDQLISGASPYADPNMRDTTTFANNDACPFTWATTYNDKRWEDHMFFDNLHPTTLAHCGLAKAIEHTLGFAGGATAHPLADCSKRYQNSDWKWGSTTYKRRHLGYDVEVAPIYVTMNPATVCAHACPSQYTHWTGNWTNYTITRSGHATEVGVCGCSENGPQ